jgi:excisionase family DNA binding protein
MTPRNSVQLASLHDALWNVDEVARLLGFTRKGVYGLVESRRIPFVRLPARNRRGGPIRFVPAEVLRWLEQNVSPLQAASVHARRTSVRLMHEPGTKRSSSGSSVAVTA